MIKVNIKQQLTDDRIVDFEVTGHAGYDKSGKDIVCSAVSALTIGAINSVEKLLNIDLDPVQGNKGGGYLSWRIPVIADDQKAEHLQLLMKALRESLLMIEQDYNKYLMVNIERLN